MRKNEKRLTGLVTLPAEAGKEKEILELARLWGADTVRDSDGTALSDELLQSGCKIYSTICLVRADQQWAHAHRGHLAEKFVMSHPVTACSKTVRINLMQTYYRRKYELDVKNDPKKYWEVIDRTSGKVVDAHCWSFDAASGNVLVEKAIPMHVYTVNFLVYQTWDSTSMYNHLINQWSKPPVISVDPYYPETYRHLMDYFEAWLKAHPRTDIVRLTTLAYHFTIDTGPDIREKYRDWLGYTDCINPLALDDFARDYSYRLRSEDIVDQGYYNATYRVPSKRYLDWMDFIQKFVAKFGRELVRRIHRSGKKAAIFFGDHWIGLEPYGKRYQRLGIDINIGACEDGVALRRLADIPGAALKEIRLYPYFFPDVFKPGGDPLKESRSNWVKIRRALFRKPVDRIGYGGYPSLALKFPEFVSHVAGLCGEFRAFLEKSKKTKPYTQPVKVAVLNAWGELRSWINALTPDEKFKEADREDVTFLAGSNLLECLAGLPVEVSFMSFADIEKNGIPKNIAVIINDGAAGTAWSGGCHWKNEKIVSAIRRFVRAGGGFIGVQDPSACACQGAFYQLRDLLGVDKETGQSILCAKITKSTVRGHFIQQDQVKTPDFGILKSFVYLNDKNAEVLYEGQGGHVLAAINTYGHGRAVYLAGLPFGFENSRLLFRSLLWATRKEKELYNWFSFNMYAECVAFPATGWYAAANNTGVKQTTVISAPDGWKKKINLKPWKIVFGQINQACRSGKKHECIINERS